MHGMWLPFGASDDGDPRRRIGSLSALPAAIADRAKLTRMHVAVLLEPVAPSLAANCLRKVP
jgi:hypothetical protein